MPDRPDRWADPLTRVIFAAHPQSGLFREFIHFAVRTKLDSPGMFAAADVGSVCRELEVGAADLADAIEVPEAFAYAVLRGWHRPGLRGLAVLADALTVPMDAFFFDDDHQLRPHVRRYVDYHEIAPMITTLGEN